MSGRRIAVVGVGNDAKESPGVVLGGIMSSAPVATRIVAETSPVMLETSTWSLRPVWEAMNLLVGKAAMAASIIFGSALRTKLGEAM